MENLFQAVRKNVGSESWIYIPTSINATDIAIRILQLVVFVIRELWWTGPEFLDNENTQVPRQKV